MGRSPSGFLRKFPGRSARGASGRIPQEIHRQLVAGIPREPWEASPGSPGKPSEESLQESPTNFPRAFSVGYSGRSLKASEGQSPESPQELHQGNRQAALNKLPQPLEQEPPRVSRRLPHVIQRILRKRGREHAPWGISKSFPRMIPACLRVVSVEFVERPSMQAF